MDRRNPYALSVRGPPDDQRPIEVRTGIQALLRDFVLEFRLDNVFIYR